MNKEELIAKLQELPDGTEIYIYDTYWLACDEIGSADWDKDEPEKFVLLKKL